MRLENQIKHKSTTAHAVILVARTMTEVGEAREFENSGYALWKSRLCSVLKNKEFLGNVAHYEIRNLSGWYYNRKVLGAKFHSARWIKVDQGGSLYKAAIYESRANLASRIIKPVRKELGIFNSYYTAHTACDRAIIDRDYGNENAIEEASHLFLLIVSDAFDMLTHTERVELVFQALLTEFFVPNFHTTDKKAECGKAKCLSFMGRNSSDLPHRRHLHGMGFKLLLELHSTNQWLDTGELATTGTKINAMKPVDNLEKIGDILKDILFEEKKSVRSLSQGPLGHFFHDLRGDAKTHIMSFNKNRATTCKAKNESTCASHTISKSRRNRPYTGKCHRVLPCGDLEAEILAKHEYLWSQISSCAIRMQRIHRIKLLSRIELGWRRKQRSALLMQCAVRAVHARKDVKRYKSTLTSMCVKVQSMVRCRRQQAFSRTMKKIFLAAALVLQLMVRKWLENLYISWAKKHRKEAVILQQATRRLLAHTVVARMQRKRYIYRINFTATKLQIVLRQHTARSIYKRYFIQQRTLLCVTIIQTRWRQRTCRALIEGKRNQLYSAILIQRSIRVMYCRVALSAVRCKRYNECCAVQIQAILRKAMCRTVHHQLARIRYEKNVEVPNTTKIQSQYRVHKCRQCLQMKRNRLMAIEMIQMIFRRRNSARAIAATKIRCATQIQNFYRAFSRRHAYSVQLLAQRSTRIYASLLISSFWMKYRDGIRVQAAKECSLIKHRSALLKQLQKQQKNVQKELSENIRYETSQEVLLKRFRIRRHVVKQDIKGASQRLAEVEGSLEEIQLCIDYKYRDTHADSTQWIELFTNEVLAIRNQIEMGFEELHSCSVYISHCYVS